MKLTVVIISYNTKQLLKRVIQSLPKRADIEIIVVDNASTDKSVEMVRKNFPYIEMIENKANVGFAQANNLAIKKSKGKQILLLNSDTIVLEGALGTMQKLLSSSSKVGIVSGQLLNEDKSVQPQGGCLPNLANIAFWMLFIDDLPFMEKILCPYQMRKVKEFTKERRTGWVGGTAMMVKKDVFNKIGLLNEDFFMYGEDVEFCLRADKAGYKIMLTPEAKIIHLGSKSSKGNPSQAWVGEYKAIKYIFSNYKPAWQLPLVRLLLKLGALLRIVVFGILLGREQAYAAYKKAYQVA